MLRLKKGASIISLGLCLVAVCLVTSALVVARKNNYEYKASLEKSVEDNAYVKVYTLDEVNQIARRAYVDEYLQFAEGKVTISTLKENVLLNMQNTIPYDQLLNFDVFVFDDGVTVEYK